MGAAESLDPRDESEAERNDRNLAELLQELRVAGRPDYLIGPYAQASRSIGQLMQRGPPRPRPSSPPGTVITSMPFSCR
jgi:hypothetical protein